MTNSETPKNASSTFRTAPTPLSGGRTAPPPDELLREATDLHTRLGDGFAFSHITAARLLGWPVPVAAQHDTRLHVITATARGRVRRRGVVGHCGIESRRTFSIMGLPFTSPEDTWIDLGEYVGNGLPFFFDDIIVAGDQALNMTADAAVLTRAVERRVSPRAKKMFVPALGMMRRGSWSGGESRFRLGVHRCRLPIPLLNIAVHRMDGTLLAILDHMWKANRTFREYQGHEFHSEPDAVAADGDRFTRLSKEGWIGRPVGSDEVWDTDKRNAALLQLADDLRVPHSRLDLAAAEPQSFPPIYQPSRRRRDPS